MGAVWRARHAWAGRSVALKLLRSPDGAAAPEAERRFLVEARAAAKLRHPNVVVVHDVGGATLSAAVALAPECALEDAMAMVFATALGFSDALGALAPPEVAVHMVWPAGLRVNGARCGGLRAAASTR